LKVFLNHDSFAKNRAQKKGEHKESEGKRKWFFVQVTE